VFGVDYGKCPDLTAISVLKVDRKNDKHFFEMVCHEQIGTTVNGPFLEYIKGCVWIIDEHDN